MQLGVFFFVHFVFAFAFFLEATVYIFSDGLHYRCLRLALVSSSYNNVNAIIGPGTATGQAGS